MYRNLDYGLKIMIWKSQFWLNLVFYSHDSIKFEVSVLKIIGLLLKFHFNNFSRKLYKFKKIIEN